MDEPGVDGSAEDSPKGIERDGIDLGSSHEDEFQGDGWFAHQAGSKIGPAPPGGMRDLVIGSLRHGGSLVLLISGSAISRTRCASFTGVALLD
ncbi:MAG: hypothetical protein AAF355_03505 [Myxococcota bacterium]